MKSMKKIFTLVLAFSIVFSVVSMQASAFESPIIPINPVPGAEATYVYEFDDEAITASLVEFNPSDVVSDAKIESVVYKNNQAYPVVAIADGVFAGTSIQSVVISEGVTSIGKNAFKDCASLKSVSVAESVVSVGEDAFAGTPWFESLEDGLVCIGKAAYKVKGTCPAKVVIPVGTVSISAVAFSDCTTMQSLIIPASVTEIADSAFTGCDAALVFYGAEGSAAHFFASTNRFNFVICPALILEAAPTKDTYYQNDSLDLAGAEVVYVSEAGFETVALTSGMASGFDSSVLGEKTVTITYEGLTVDFSVEIVERPPYIPGDLDGDEDIDSDDAVYLLFHTLFGNSRYPVTQSADFDNSGAVDSDDAVYLLFHTLFGNDRYPVA